MLLDVRLKPKLNSKQAVRKGIKHPKTSAHFV